jgi:RNA polymerase sigma-70 factor, ECF subfamily
VLSRLARAREALRAEQGTERDSSQKPDLRLVR